jgi:putative ABC transport system permease protein
MTWLWRALLVIFGREFRRRHGAEVLAAIDAERQERRNRGVAGCVRFAIRVSADLVIAAARHHTAPHRFNRVRAKRTRGSMDIVRQDVRYALRQMRRRPGFAAVAVISLALGIGGNTAVFGIADSLVLHPFSFPQPDRLLLVGVSFPRVTNETTFVESMSPLDYEEFRGARSFAATAAFDLGNRNLSGGDIPERVFTALLLDDPFPVLGLPPLLGRGFTPDELRPSGPPVAIISHRLWKSRFHGDASLIGRSLRVNGAAATLVGVMPPQLLLLGTDLWIPWGGDRQTVPRNRRQFSAIARLAPDASLRGAEAELSAIAARVAADHKAQFPEYDGWHLVPRPLAAGLLEQARPAAFLVVGAVMLVLLIACANLASLILARATGRQRELAVRVALGAGRRRLVQQVVTEIAVLAIAGGSAGFAVAAAAVRAANAFVPAQFAAFGLHAALNVRVALWCLCSTSLAIVFVAVLPIVQMGRTDPNESLKQDARGATTAPGSRRLRYALIVAETALAVMLALGAGLLMRSFVNLQRVATGVDADGVVTMRLTLPSNKYKTGAAMTEFFEELARKVEELPSVERAGLTSQFPPMEFLRSRVMINGATPGTGTVLPSANLTVVTPGYFDTLGIAVRAGRAFDAHDRAGSPRVAIVNEAFAARYFEQGAGLGRRIQLGDNPAASPAAEVVGMVANTANVGAAAPAAPEVFVPLGQRLDNQLFLMTKVAGEPRAAVSTIRQAVASLDPDQPVYGIQTLAEAFEASTVAQQVSTVLLGMFAAVAVVLAGVGIYGVTAYAVQSRTQEIGIRMAMGADRRLVIWMVMRQVLAVVAAGMAVGFSAIILSGRLFTSVLFGVTTLDGPTLAATATLFSTVALLAAWKPAAAASSVDPVVALRCE